MQQLPHGFRPGLGSRQEANQVSAEPTRRMMLAVAGSGTLLLAGCKGIAALGPLPTLAPDVRTLDEAIRSEELMVATYQAALSSLGSGADRIPPVLTTVLAEHQAHLAQLRKRLVLPPRLATASPRPSPTPPALPSGRGRIVASLVAAERDAAARLARQLLEVPPSLAQLMASIGASEAAHAVVLAAARRR
jgi:hypothetical protein